MDIRVKVRKKEYRVTKDKHNFIISEVRISKNKTKYMEKGQEYCKEIGFYTKIENVINTLCMMHLDESDVTTLKELKTELKGIREFIRRQFE